MQCQLVFDYATELLTNSGDSWGQLTVLDPSHWPCDSDLGFGGSKEADQQEISQNDTGSICRFPGSCTARRSANEAFNAVQSKHSATTQSAMAGRGRGRGFGRGSGFVIRDDEGNMVLPDKATGPPPLFPVSAKRKPH
jgi:hypothetical protein